MNRWVFGPGIGLVVAAAVAVSACGTAITPTAEQAGQTSSAPAAPAAGAGASGTVAAVAATSIQVQNPRIGQVTVTFTPSTSFTETASATAADLVVGDCVFAAGTPQPTGGSAGPLTATSVLISPPAAGDGCPVTGPGQARGTGRGYPGGTAAPRASNQPPGRGRGATVVGKITSVSGSGFVVQLGSSNTTRSVTTTQATTFSKNVTTDKSSLAVGECVNALGPSDDTGTVAASSISIRQGGPNGCQGGFGGPGRAGRGGASAGTDATSGA